MAAAHEDLFIVHASVLSPRRACTAQIRSLSAGRGGVLVPDAAIQAEVAAQTAALDGRHSYADRATTDLVWAAELRRLDALSPGYAA